MNERNISLFEAAALSGIAASELHGMIWRGELAGVAFPGNREMGHLPEGAIERLIGAQRMKEPHAVPMQLTRAHFQAIPLEQAAADLGLTILEVERLLSQGKLEGTYIHPRWTGVKSLSLALYREQVGH
jgi:hypothetical protein